MKDAVKDLKNRNSLVLDFYDRNRLATWVRDHGGMILWVRQKIGKSVPGWHPYGAWAYSPNGVQGEYLLDDKLRVRTGRKEKGDGLSAVDGLNRIRELFEKPGEVARIVGLSGVGKTRFVQALFDNRVGKRPLDPSIAIYTNLADDPNPAPITMVTVTSDADTRTMEGLQRYTFVHRFHLLRAYIGRDLHPPLSLPVVGFCTPHVALTARTALKAEPSP